MLERIYAALKTQTPALVLESDPGKIESAYRYWRTRIMYSMITGYAVFYFVRKNFSIANPEISKEFGFSNTQMGTILSVSTIVYAFSKFSSGVIADRANPRYFMAAGLILSAAANFFFGTASALWFFIVFWAVNNLFQGMGMAPCSKLLSTWFSPSARGRAFGIWNSSHQIGGAGILILSGYIVSNLGWRWAFFIPAIIAAIVSLFLVNRLRDTPASLGLPDPEGMPPRTEAQHAESGKDIFVNYILKNKMVWVVSFTNIFVYIVRTGVFDWAPKFLKNARGFSTEEAGWATSAFEMAGMFGAFFSGWLSDRVFGGRRGPVALVFMAITALSVFGLYQVQSGFLPIMILMSCIGFFLYGPQVLVAIAAVDFATPRAGAAAVGLTGLFGYIGATICGIGTGVIVDAHGWNGGLMFYLVSAIIGTLLFVTLLGRRPSPA